MRRSITKNNLEVYELLKEYKEESIKLGEINQKLEALEPLEEERNKLAIKGQKIKDKMAPIVFQLAEGECTEFEKVVNVREGENEGDIYIDILDLVEQFKEEMREQNKKEAEQTRA